MIKTKIVCTIGPASDNAEMLGKLMDAGMNVARLNFSHNTAEDHLNRIKMIKKVRKELGIPVAILLDTKGPEYRVGLFKGDKVFVETGSKFTFTTEEVIGDSSIASVNYKNLHQDLNVGDIILVNNGLLEFKVVEIDGQNIHSICLVGGELSNRKSMNFPNKVMSFSLIYTREI